MTNQGNEQVQSNHPKAPPKVSIGEPIFINQSSYEGCTTVLRKIGVAAKLVRYGGGQRHWIIVCCNGLPFRLCNIIIHGTYCCSKCHKSFFQLHMFKNHVREAHNGETTNYYLKFEWVELNWIHLISKLDDILGFRSDKEKYIAKACRDHHKAWQMILMFYFGSLKELCVSYVRDIHTGTFCDEQAGVTQPSPEGFFKYCGTKANNANFIYLLTQVTLYAQAIINYRMSLRRNNFDLGMSAIHKLSSLFHGQNHPIINRLSYT